MLEEIDDADGDVIETKITHSFRLGIGAGHTIRSVSSDGQETLFEFSLEEKKIRYTITGESRQGEADTDRPCWILGKYLNRIGADWKTLQRYQGKEQGIDWLLVDTQGHKQLRIQVVRALTDQKIWKTLARQGSVSGEAYLDELVTALFHTVQQKATRYGQRGDITLALDAVEPGNSAFWVVEAFRKTYGADCMKLGFQSIWLVGPTDLLVYQLDTTEPPTH